MPTPLTQADIDSLTVLVQAENRLGYYDYLAAKGYAYGALAGDVVRDQGLSGVTANLFAENKADELGKSLTASEWTQLSIRLMQEDFDAVVNAFAATGGGSVDVSLDVETIRNYHSNVIDDFNNLPPQTWTAYTPTLVVADADALWAEILSAGSFWGELATGLGVMGEVVDATPLLFRPAYNVVAAYLHLGPAAGPAAPVAGPAGKAIMQGLADLSLSGNAALAHEWLDDMLFDRVAAQAMAEASLTDTYETLKDALGLGRSLATVSGPEGTPASELVLGGEGRDTLMGGAGNDVIHADALQSYLLDAFPDTDPWLTGGDAIDGGDGNDVLAGGAGHNYLLDDEGDNLLYGGAGNDVLDPLGEYDTLVGGPGNDLILANWEGAGQTVVFGEGDGLDLVSMSLVDDHRVVIDGDVSRFITYNLYGADYPVILIELTSGDMIYFPEASYSIYDIVDREAPTTIFADNGSWTKGEALLLAEDNLALIDSLDLDSCGEGAAEPGGDVVGGAGPDTLAGWSAADNLSGAGGNDLLTGAGDDTLFGGPEADTLTGGTGNDTANGDAGDDTLLPDAGTDTLDGGVGQDWIDASGATSTVHTIDLMLGKLVGLGAQDVVLGVEHVLGSSYGEGVIGDNSANTLLAEGGNDHLWANAGDDFAWGGEGLDDLHGGVGVDTLYGSDGADTLDGQQHGDTLEGGWGDDTLIGGSGADCFAFSPFAGSDRVTDFLSGTDKLDLSSFDYTSAAQVLALATASGTDTVLALYQCTIRLLGLAPSQLAAADILLSDE